MPEFVHPPPHLPRVSEAEAEAEAVGRMERRRERCERDRMVARHTVAGMAVGKMDLGPFLALQGEQKLFQ